jgi:putative ABC transport system substrate-binding protein
MRGTHQGQQSPRTAPTGRTHDCKRPLHRAPHDLLHSGGHPHMRRRSVVITGLAALLLAPERSAAQQTQAKIPRVGILTTAASESAAVFEAFRQGLRDFGYVEGRNIILEFRLARGNLSLGPKLAAELVALPVDVIVAEGFTPDAAAASDRIPIVAPALVDPVQRGLASSLSRPGGNITGFTLMHTELNAKRLELLRTAFPLITAVTALVNPANPAHKLGFEQIETAARLLGLGSVGRVEAESAAALRALPPAVFSGASAVVVVPDGMFYSYRRDIIGLVNAARLPAIYPERDYADDGGLMAYGANVSDNFRRAADYVDRILKGAKPADLPIQEPVKFDFIVNLKTAKELVLTIPPAILAHADEVIE